MNSFIILLILLLFISVISDELDELLEKNMRENFYGVLNKISDYNSFIRLFITKYFEVENELFDEKFREQSESVKGNAKLYMLGYQLENIKLYQQPIFLISYFKNIFANLKAACMDLF